MYTYDISNTQIDSLAELLNHAIAGFTLHPNDFPDFKLLSPSTNKKNLADMQAYVLEGHYKDPELGKQMVLEDRHYKRWYKLLYTIFCKSFTVSKVFR